MKPKNKIDSINWKEIQQFYDEGGTYKDIREKFGICFATISKAVKRGYLITIKKRITPKCGCKGHTEESKRKISESRKKFLKENPDRPSWRKVQAKDSIPMKFVKDFLNNRKIDFIPEYQPLIHKDRFFAIDIAFPDKKIGWEINGGQHYDTNGNLKPYYEERHKLIELEGWELIEIPYNHAFKLELLEFLLIKLGNTKNVSEFDYKNLKIYKKKQNVCLDCQKPILNSSLRCLECHNKNVPRARKVERPTKEDLGQLIENNSFAALSRQFGVTDNSIRKWCRYYQLEIPKKKKWAQGELEPL